MVTKYFRFNMSDDNEDTHWGYATGNGEYSSENASLNKIPYDEATGIIRSWLKNCGAITNTLEIDDAVARAFSKGSTSAVFHYDNGEKYRMTIETADNPVTEWEDFLKNNHYLKEENTMKKLFENSDLFDYVLNESSLNEGKFADKVIPTLMPKRVKESINEGDKFKNKNGAVIEIIEYDEDENYVLYKVDDNFHDTHVDSIENILSKNGYEKLNESSLNEGKFADNESSNNNSTKLHESIQGTVGDFCRLKGIDTDQFVEFLQTNFDWARHCEVWTIVDFDCLERCFSKLDEATIAQAKRFASRKHGETGAVRKATGQPYIVHPEGVAALVKENGGDDEQIQAAWLHDTIEDTGATYDDIVEKFGKRVADIVSEVTNKPHLKKSEKEAYMTNKLKNLSHDALLVKLCDMRYNYYDYAPIEQRMRIEKNIKELMSSRELTKEEWQLCEEILDWDNTVEGLDENVFSKTLRLSSLNA
jgi:(p)ppGpp synthase/HD superfamily hydrolase